MDGTRTPETAFAAAWILIPLLPALDIAIFPAGELVHDRYFYVPSVGAALAIALLIEALGRGSATAFGQPVRRIAAALTLAVLLAFATASATHSWSDDYTLFTRANQIAPQNLIARNNLSLEWLKHGQEDKAEKMLDQTLSEHPEDWLATYNLSRVRYLKKEYPEAERLSRRAIHLVPNAADPYLTLGEVQLKSDRLGDSILSMRRAVELNPFDSRFRTIYGIVLEASGDCPAATIQFDAALELNRGEAIAQREIFRCRIVEQSGPKTSPQPAQR